MSSRYTLSSSSELATSSASFGPTQDARHPTSTLSVPARRAMCIVSYRGGGAVTGAIVVIPAPANRVAVFDQSMQPAPVSFDTSMRSP